MTYKEKKRSMFISYCIPNIIYITCNICTKYCGLFSNRLCPPDRDFTGFLAKLSKSTGNNTTLNRAYNLLPKKSINYPRFKTTRPISSNSYL